MAENDSDQGELAIDVNNLTFRFPSSVSKLPALSGVDLVLPRGSIATLIGSNGAGMLCYQIQALSAHRNRQANRPFFRSWPENA